MGPLSKFALAVFLIPVICVVLLFYSTMPFHHLTLLAFSNDLFSIPPAEGEDRLERKTAIGVLQGNGNHCDYYAGIVSTTTTDREKIEQYYASNYEGKSTVNIIDMSQDMEQSACDAFSIRSNCALIDKYKDRLPSPSSGEFLYVIYIFEHGMTSRLGDARCS